ncbi:hypothetical protein EJ03DRAFT_129710 [Teratosphaeria nubilosa]|uniref:MARVEL domain-containing protein n=1 Tax=Teratosphaeria nubilosa TaxID=161662 RepID=A0A6G1LMG3_9PEZI|nr:hypothetical protein EJ03DRAFT_129710 [Teratosphaeria nubilosa]
MGLTEKLANYPSPSGAKAIILFRALSMMCLLAVLGLYIDFLRKIPTDSDNEWHAPVVMWGVLVVLILALSWTGLTAMFFREGAQYGHGNSGAGALGDLVATAASVVTTYFLGVPLSSVNCNALQNQGTPGSFDKSLIDNLGDYFQQASLTGATESDCYETKAMLGLFIALSLVFFLSSMVFMVIWNRTRRLEKSEKA